MYDHVQPQVTDLSSLRSATCVRLVTSHESSIRNEFTEAKRIIDEPPQGDLVAHVWLKKRARSVRTFRGNTGDFPDQIVDKRPVMVCIEYSWGSMSESWKSFRKVVVE